MANHNLLINLTLFVFLIYVSFLLIARFSGISYNNMMFKYTDRSGRLTYDNGTFHNASNNLVAETGFKTSSTSSPDVSLLFRATRPTPSGDLMQKVALKKKIDSGTWTDQETDIKKEQISTRRIDRKSQSGSPRRESKEEVRRDNCKRNILFWCDDTVLLNGSFFCKKCGCQLNITRSVNVRDLKDADAVIFYHYIEKPWDELIRSRPSGQIWVFFSRESPRNCRFCLPPPSYGSIFNFTMTYLSDSDLIVPYGRFIPFKKPRRWKSPLELDDWMANKTKNVLWVASNCVMDAWHRTKFVKHLAEYTDVDVYGRCGTLTCPRADKEYCQGVFKQYKFYLALENSFCREYITEKVWRNSFGNDLVPIVFGANREDYERTLPPNSFIFAEDFNSTKQLAKLLDDLKSNDNLYREYFRWRQLGKFETWNRSFTFKPDTFCQLLSGLIRFESKKMEPRRNSIEDWWRSSHRNSTAVNFKFADRDHPVIRIFKKKNTPNYFIQSSGSK